MKKTDELKVVGAKQKKILKQAVLLIDTSSTQTVAAMNEIGKVLKWL